MRLLELEVLHGVVERLKLLIHCLINLPHLYLDVCLVYHLPFQALVVASPCVFRAVVAYMVLLIFCSDDTIVKLVLHLSLEAVILDDCVDLRSQRS